MATLYRQYRPQAFSELVGQDHITKTLGHAVLQDKVTQAYLFFGPRGTGKTTTARILAKRVNCHSPQQTEPCGSCESCVAMQKHSHIDVIEIDAASNRGIDDIRALREAASFVPTLGKYKVYIIDEVHMLTREAASALLKTLEEPVPHVLFILATTDMHKVLPTIASRCQVYRFRRATRDEMRTRLTFLLAQEKREASDDAIEFIVDRADGCYRDAESLLGQMLTLHENTVSRSDMASFLGLPSLDLLEQFLAALVAGTSAPALEAVDAVFASGDDPEQLLREAIRLARDEAVRLATDEKPTWSAGLDSAAMKLPAIVRSLLQGLQDLAFVPQPMIAIQLAVLTVCTEKGVPSAAASPPRPPLHVASPSRPPQQTAPPKKVVQPRQTIQQKGDVVALSAVADAWPKLVDTVQESNPVAATFLRAVHPAAVAGSTITAHVQFALHRTFFEKPDMRKLVEASLGELLGEKITLSFVLDEMDGGKSAPTAAEHRKKHEDKFQQTVQEVFGAT